jgi:hypothetical protein
VSHEPAFDVRWPIGILWIVIGVLLVAYGVLGGGSDVRSLAVDRWWGAVMLAFGVIMVALAARHRAAHAGVERRGPND